MKRRSLAPYWILTHYGGKCCECGFGIKKGSDALYFPASKRVMCAGDGCAKKYERDAKAMREMNEGENVYR